MSKYDADDKRWLVCRQVPATKAHKTNGDYIENSMATIMIGPFHDHDQAVIYAISHTHGSKLPFKIYPVHDQ